MKKASLFISCIISTLLFYQSIDSGCTCGVVAGKASFDGRPFSWKNRDWDFQYQGVCFESDGKYKFVGLGDNGTSTMMGLNTEGLALGNSTVSDLNVSGGNNKGVMDWLLENCATVDECRTAFDEATRGVADHYNNGTSGHPSFTLPIIGKEGKAIYVEVGSQTKVRDENDDLVPAYFEYDPLDCGPDFVRKYDVVARANNTHKNSGGHDDQTTGGNRYYEARDHLHNAVIRDGIFDNDPLDNTGVTLAEMFQVSRFGNPGYDNCNCRDMSLCTMIAHGINDGENPKIAVMWSAVYKADYVPYVPVWVDLGIQGDIPMRVDRGNDAERLSYQCHRIYQEKDANDYDQYINARFIPMETNFIQAVTDARERWFEQGYVYAEAKRIADECVETSYWTVKTLADQAQSSPRNLNETPLITEITADVQNNSVTFSHNGTDPDGSIQSVYWEFGDGETSSEASPTHNYSSDGTYLVMCRVIDNDGSRNSRWKYVPVGGVHISVATLHANRISKLVSCTPSNNNVSFTLQLNKSGNYSLYVFNTKGQQLWTHHGSKENAGYFKVAWNCDNPNYQIGNKVYIAKLIHNGNQSVLKFTVAR
jgi:hypothetical protein